MREISRLQYITTSAELAEKACSGGVDWIQLRLKNVSYDEYFMAGRAVQEVCRKYNATFIVNDDIKLALDLNADGVHVGKEDPLPQHYIDEMLGKGGIIGCTANAIEDLEHLSGKPVSYIGLGPYRFTDTKRNLSPILGLDGYTSIFEEVKRRALDIPPVVGIGGIVQSDIASLMSTGLYGVAVSAAISKADDVAGMARSFIKLINADYLLQKK